MSEQIERCAECVRMSDAGEVRVALASLVKMINLMGAEMLVGKYREDIDVFESSVRGKLFANVDGVSPESTAAAMAEHNEIPHRLN